MPVAIDESGYAAVTQVQCSLDDLQDSANANGSEISFLREFLNDEIFQGLVKAQDRIENLPLASVDVSAARALAEVINVLNPLQATSKQATELKKILVTPNFQALLGTHDDVAQENYQDLPDQNHLSSPPPPVFQVMSDSVRLVSIRKSQNESLGITVKIEEETDDLVIARIMTGSLIEKQGLLHVGDIIKEVNGYPVTKPEQLMDIIKMADGGITLKIIPTCQDFQNTIQVFMKAHFNYDPMKDRLIPCKEAGLTFSDGDILEILSHGDGTWWQARMADAEGITGLIPSQGLEEKRKAFVRPELDYSKSFLCGITRKKKKKIKFKAKNNTDFDRCELVVYEEVARMPPFQRKSLVIVGAHGIGRRSLKERLLYDDPIRFGAAMPHTSRAPREGEEPGKGYYFVDRASMEAYVKNDQLIEHGEFNNNIYGTLFDTIRNVMRNGKMCVLDVNSTSLKKLKNAEFMPFIVFIAAPSVEALRTVYEEGRKRAARSRPGRPGFPQTGSIKLKTEEDMVATMQESAQIEKVYKGYFDLTIVNDNFEATYRTLKKALNDMSSETQWVPVNWVY